MTAVSAMHRFFQWQMEPSIPWVPLAELKNSLPIVQCQISENQKVWELDVGEL